MQKSVQKHLEAEQLLKKGETIVVGVSGGVDSTVLLHLLHAINERYGYEWKLHAVHLNHGFRGEEAKRDAAYVEELCQAWGIEAHLFERDVPAYMEETGLGAQEASRNLRYSLYVRVAVSVGATKVAVAHHADDQVETILFRLLRGTSPRGFAGMPKRRLLADGIELVRPLLPFYKSDLEAYCQEVRLSPQEDSSNQSRKYDRNRLRLDVLPLLESINSRYREHILNLAYTIEEEDTYLMHTSRELVKEVTEAWQPDRVTIDLNKFQSCDLALQRRMITLILSYLSSGIEWSSQHVEAVLRVATGKNPSAVLHLPAHVVVQRVYGQLHLCGARPLSSDQEAKPFGYTPVIPGSTYIAESNMTFHFSIVESLPQDIWRTGAVAAFDADRLHDAALCIRNRRAGDRIPLLGTNGSTKLKEVLIDAKVPKNLRDRLPLLVDGDEILWVPGVKRSRVAVVDERSKRVLMVKVEYGEEWREVFE